MSLLPRAITDWVAEGRLACVVSEILEELHREGALAACYEQYRREDGWGSAAHHPLMMVKILVYG